MFLRIIIFLAINFLALGLGGLFTGKGVPSDWYSNLNKAPWTPPGWVFGAAWTFIMICFSFYMAIAYEKVSSTKFLLLLFSIQWILNVSWNPTFFYFQNVIVGFIVILALTLLVAYFIFQFKSEMKIYNLLLAPYLIWLIIASSLNGYILFNN